MRINVRGRVPALLVAVGFTAAACGHGGQPATAPVPVSPSAAGPHGAALSHDDIAAVAAQFTDQPLTGGQRAPRRYRWVNDKGLVFLQFDNPDPAKATALRYVGIAVNYVAKP